jgi:hypothetical protein
VPYSGQAGSVLPIPPGMPHRAQPIGGEQVLNTGVFALVRADLRHLTDYQDAKDHTDKDHTDKDPR